MRPKSIIMFERLFLASLALGAANVGLSYEAAAVAFANDPGVQRLGLDGGSLLGITIAGFAVYLVLWFLVAHRASTVAKWILVVCVAVGALAALPALGGWWNVTLVLSLVVRALEIVALIHLFRPDATAWLGGPERVDGPAAD